ncbi:MAG: histidine kinase [Leptothrix sp. (in: Bacteria)]|nr:histidine kinase [Leptothrix sp. (in: b-proteobacteria)]
MSIGSSLELMSRELNERNAQLRVELQERQRSRDALQLKTEEQQALIARLEEAHNQLLQSEKMASIGQLAAGVAHEINNPIGFVASNLSSLRRYVDNLLRIVNLVLEHKAELGPAAQLCLERALAESDFEYLREDMVPLLDESADGVRRVKRIVQDLKDFSHVGEHAWQWSDLHKGLDSTLNIVHNEIKYVADVSREYGALPMVECLASQLNQVFMNLLVNAAHALEGKRGQIVLATRMLGEGEVCVEVRDTGEGIAPENLTRIFDPFFTTKAVGKGTGLGLSLSYSIVRKHRGRIEVESRLGGGTTFRVVLPITQSNVPAPLVELAQ